MKIWINDTESNVRVLSYTRGEITRTILLSTRGVLVLPSLTSNSKGSSMGIRVLSLGMRLAKHTLTGMRILTISANSIPILSVGMKILSLGMRPVKCLCS